MRLEGTPLRHTEWDKCQYCGSKKNVDFILGVDKFLCEECFGKLHNTEEDEDY